MREHYDAAAGPPRGLLRDREDGPGAFSHARLAPGETVAPWVAHYWVVAWTLPAGVSRTVRSAPHPTVHVVANRAGVLVHGVHTTAFETTLAGEERVVGIKFRPGAFRGLLGRDVSTLRDRTVDAATLFGAARVAAWHGRLASLDDERAVAAATEAFVSSLGLARDADADLAGALVARAECDGGLRTVEALARHGGLSVRALQRLFRAHVGVTPKWVVMSYRLHDLIERLTDDEVPDWAAVAADLGYFDQSHLIGDFRRVFGMPPAEYARSRR